MCISYNEVKAQSIEGTGPDCLGIWCYVDATVGNPTVNRTITCTIPKPPYEITGIYGVGSPYISNDSGSTIEIQLNSFHLIPEMDDTSESTVLDLEMTVAYYINDYECHYHIKLILWK